MYIRQIFLIQMEYRLQSMYNHMVGRTVSVESPSNSYSLDKSWKGTVVNRFLLSSHGRSLTLSFGVNDSFQIYWFLTRNGNHPNIITSNAFMSKLGRGVKLFDLLMLYCWTFLIYSGWPKCTDCTDFYFVNPKIVRIVRIFILEIQFF